MDAGRAYIPENNIPSGFGVSSDRRVFVSLPRCRTGVYSNLGYFHLDDVGHDEVCPPLKPFPPRSNVTLNADCCTERNVVNVDKLNIDSHNRLWVLDRQALGLNDKNWNLASPRLLVWDLKTDTLVREAVLPAETHGNGGYQLGLVSVILNVDKNNANKAYAYIIDTYHGCLVVYSWEQNKFWKVCSPQFYSDAKYSKFHLKTCKNKEVTYYKDNFIVDCTTDLKNEQLVCHSDAQLDEYTVPFDQLNDEATARCSPNSLNVHFLGQKRKYGQSAIHVMNKETQVVWTVQELSHGVACWNRENPLHPEAVELVVSDHYKLKYISDLQLISVDLSKFCDDGCHGYPKNYVVTLTNNYRSIVAHGFDHQEENFAFYFFVEDEAVEAHPQCLQQHYHHKPTPHYPAPRYEAPYEPAPYKPTPYQPAPYKPTPHYQPTSHQYSPRPSPHHSYSSRPYSPPQTYQYGSAYRVRKSSSGVTAAEEVQA